MDGIGRDRSPNEPKMKKMSAENLPQRKKVRLKDFDYASRVHVFFVTLCTVRKQPYFKSPDVCTEIVSELEFRRTSDEIKLFCFCIMPDHLHLLISLKESYTRKNGAFGDRTLQKWVSSFKRYSARRVGQMWDINPLWQKNFYDHVVRDDESLIEICEYILNNPVRKGISSSWEEYQYSKTVDPLPH
jgi:REP element-mobilizing transposase RayT